MDGGTLDDCAVLGIGVLFVRFVQPSAHDGDLAGVIIVVDPTVEQHAGIALGSAERERSCCCGNVNSAARFHIRLSLEIFFPSDSTAGNGRYDRKRAVVADCENRTEVFHFDGLAVEVDRQIESIEELVPLCVHVQSDVFAKNDLVAVLRGSESRF